MYLLWITQRLTEQQQEQRRCGTPLALLSITNHSISHTFISSVLQQNDRVGAESGDDSRAGAVKGLIHSYT